MADRPLSARCKECLMYLFILLFFMAASALVALALLYFMLLKEVEFSTTSNNNAGESFQSFNISKTSPQTATTMATTVSNKNKTAKAGSIITLDVTNPKHRINCFPEQQATRDKSWDITEEQCIKRGCKYDTDTGDGSNIVPICYMHPREIGYKVKEVIKSDPTFLISLKLEPISPSSSIIFDPAIKEVTFKALIWNNQHLQIKIEDANDKRYEVPFTSQLAKDSTADANTADFEVTYTAEPVFTFQVKRKSSGTVLFDTTIGGFVFSDRFLQLATFLPSNNLYGLGEHEHPSLRHNMEQYKTWPMFARDQGGLGEGNNLYGTHPFYMVLEEDGNAHGVFLLNSNAMEFSTIPAPGIIIRTIGGIFDLHISTGPEPEQVIQQHTAMVGRPFIPPYWALGFHLSRYGYNSLEKMKAAIDRTRSAGIPLDAIYADIDHMDARKDFTIDQKNFNGLQQYFADELKNNGLRSIIILDPAIPEVKDGSYEPWAAFQKSGAFITWPNKTVMYGYVWPDDLAAFPDFLRQSTRDVWNDLIVKHSKTIQFDGVWIDMNEPANFGTNEAKPWNWPHPDPWSLKCEPSYYDAPPYRTWSASLYDTNERKAMLSDKTLCMEAKQGENGQYRHYDVHNLYGWSQTLPTLEAVRKAYPGRRGFVLARSTFAGSGQYATHWLGDNLSTWPHLRRSIIGMLEMSMFGIAHTGPDICGFMETATPELCLRWMQLGAFYPYSRNHNDAKSPDQDPGVFGKDVAETSAYYMKLRYENLPYLYTLFYYANKDGSTVARPLFFEFPKDRETYGCEWQFMLGSAFMVAPLITQGDNSVTAYLPQGTWVNIAQEVQFVDRCSGGEKFEFKVNGTVFLQRGGSVVPTQSSDVKQGKSITTQAIRTNPFSLSTVLDCDNKANGSLFWDDGDSLNTISTGKYLLAEYAVEYDDKEEGHLQLTSRIVHKTDDKTTIPAAGLIMKSFIFYGVDLKVTAKQAEVTCNDCDDKITIKCHSFTATTHRLECSTTTGIPITSGFSVKINF